MDKLRDTMDKLKKLPGKIKDKAVDKLKDKMDAINPLSAINISGTEGLKQKRDNLRDKKKDNTEKNRKITTKIKVLTRKIKGSK